MITVRVNSVSSGSGYPRIVYNSRHERMGDAMVLNGARGEPNRFEKNNRGKEKERSEKIPKLGEGGGATEGKGRQSRFNIKVLWKQDNSRTPPRARHA